MPRRKQLGQVLIDAGLIDQFQLRAALGQQDRWGRRLGLNLVSMGFIRESDLVGALSTQLGIPVARIDERAITPEVLDLVPLELVEKYTVFPLAVKGPGNRTLVLGMEDPCDLTAVDALSFRTGMDIEPVLLAPSELSEVIDRFYRGQRKRRATRRAPAVRVDLATSCQESTCDTVRALVSLLIDKEVMDARELEECVHSLQREEVSGG